MLCRLFPAAAAPRSLLHPTFTPIVRSHRFQKFSYWVYSADETDQSVSDS